MYVETAKLTHFWQHDVETFTVQAKKKKKKSNQHARKKRIGMSEVRFMFKYTFY